MTTFGDALVDSVRQAFCGAIAIADRFSELLYPVPLLGDYPVAARQFASRLFCNVEPPTLPGGVAGGQCPTSYTVSIRWRAIALDGSGLPDENSVDTFTVTGPFGGARVVTDAGRFFAEISSASIPIAGGA